MPGDLSYLKRETDEHLKAMDGSCVQLADTLANQCAYLPPSAAHRVQGVDDCAKKAIDIRQLRSEPPANKRRPKGDPLLTWHPNISREIPHLGHLRSAA